MDLILIYMKDPKILVLFIASILCVMGFLYEVLNQTRLIKRDELIEKSKNFEKMVESSMNTEKFKWFNGYNNILKELLPTRTVFNIYILIALAAVASIFTFEKVSKVLNQSTAGFIAAIAMFVLPFFMLDILVALRRRQVRKHLPHFLLMFQQTYEVTGDAIESLETIQNEIKDPIKRYIKEFLRNIKKDMSYKEAIEILKTRSENEQFKYFAEIIHTEIEYGKMIKAEIMNNIKHAFAHEENYAARLTENTGSMVSIAIVVVLFLSGIQRLSDISDDFMKALLTTKEGNLAVDIVMIIMIAVVFLVRKSISYKDD